MPHLRIKHEIYNYYDFFPSFFSVKSDDSDADSDYFVVINSQTEDAARDNHLFAITSKRTSPVLEYAAEATEEVAASTFVVPSSDLGIKSSASSSANVAMVSPPKEEDNGVVRAPFLRFSYISCNFQHLAP